MPAIQVVRRGPIFSPGVGRIVDQVVSATIKRIVEDGEGRLAQVARPRPSGVFLSFTEASRGQYSTGNYRRHINSRVQTLSARLDLGNLRYGAWIEGTSSRNTTTRFKGYAIFRNTAQWMQKRVPRYVRETAAKLKGRLS